MEKEIRRLKADVRRYRRLSNTYKDEGDLVNRIVSVVRDAVESLPAIDPPVLFVPGEAEHDEVAVLLLSDVHVGKKTKSYNHRVFAKRLDNLRDRVLSVVQVQRAVRPISKLVILWLGDIVDAESIYPAQAIDHISVTIIDQLFSVGLPRFADFVHSMLANFQEVECYCVKGNHGKLNAAKWSSSKSTNWDFVFYKALESLTQGQDRLTWHINTKDWKQTFKIFREGFLICHGDMIKRYYSTPFYGWQRQAQRWQGAYRDKIRLTHFCYGHFHQLCTGMRFNTVNIFTNGSFVSDDPFADEVLGVSSEPEQLLFGIHPKKGVSWRYAISLR